MGSNSNVSPIASGSPASISFVATSKKEAAEPQLVERGHRRPSNLHDVLRANKTFRHAVPNGRIVQSSTRNDNSVFAAPNGLVAAVVEAYNSHHELVLRPDDVWQAILTQLSFYVQANSEELRDRLVDFQGKRQLTVTTGGTLFTVDFGTLANRMVDEQIIKNIRDPAMVDWLLPAFSTTLPDDRIVASVTVMATLQAFFDYKFYLCCGIPRVTLLGTLDDWKLLRSKIDHLVSLDLNDKRMFAWQALLAPVVDQMIASVAGSPDLDFWDRVCSHIGGGSGPLYLSGWITVFSVFTEKGEWQGDERKVTESPWPIIDTQDLPVGTLSVPVLVDDNGVEYQTQMLAGQFGFDAVCDGKGIQPRSDWCIALMAEEACDQKKALVG